jgi:hypothetical protein
MSTELIWEDYRHAGLRSTLYVTAPASDADQKLKLLEGRLKVFRVCELVQTSNPIPFGRTWVIEFVQPVDGKYRHGPYKSFDQAKAMAVTLYKLRDS